MNQAAQGKSALSSGDFSSAISHYTLAISQNPQAVDYYIQRSTAYTRLSPPNHQAALKDAEVAVLLANKRGKRELIASSQLRRAIALFGVERWGDSKQCLQWVKKLNEKEKSLGIWEMKADGKLKDLEDGDDRAEVIVKETPDVDAPKSEEKDKFKAESSMAEASNNTNGFSVTTTPPAPAPSTQGVQTPADKIRSDWYQSSDAVTVTLLAKGIPKDRAHVKIEESMVEMTFPLNEGSDFDFTLDPLFSKINPDASSVKIMSTKAEFMLKKAASGLKWASLERTGPVASKDGRASNDATGDGLNKEVPPVKTANSAPAYPTSSKSGPKNWDKVAANLTKKPKKEEDDDGTDDKDIEPALDDEFEGDAVDGFFKKLFKDADPDTKRAMMKSYQESNGTALSTNWAEVSKKTTETSPPDGMEAKKWGG